MMARYDDWPRRLNEYIEARRDKPFRYGSNDCVAFAVHAIVTITTSGRDLPALPRYKTQEEAGSMLATLPLERRVRLALGDPLPTPNLAQRGDLVMHLSSLSGEPSLAICYGPGYVSPGRDGLLFSPDMSGTLLAWRI